MSRPGHLVAALSTAAIAVAIGPDVAHAICAIGLILGASIPDQIELVVGFTPSGRRLSMMEHRGISHSPLAYAILALIASFMPGNFALFGSGLMTGALVHIVIDALSPMGVPLVPGLARWSCGHQRSAGRAFVYRTGTTEEYRVLAPLAAVTTIIIVARFGAIASASMHFVHSIRL